MNLLRNFRKKSDSLTTFNDISKKKVVPKASSKILQFYSANRNIGNYTPVLGIQEMLGAKLDTWNIHRTPIDWDFVHKNYESVIVGGAGLLHRVFEDFWIDLEKNCRLPIVIWGIGVCLPTHEVMGGVSEKVVREVFSRAILANVRDELTRDHYDLDSSTSITICPTIAYISRAYEVKASQVNRGAGELKKILHSHHINLEPGDLTPRIKELVQNNGWRYTFTDNVESEENLLDFILQKYPRNDAVVTTRLHGAIIAYSFRRPYFALSFDPKIDAFVKLYGGGTLASSMQELQEHMESFSAPKVSNYEVELAKVHKFGELARQTLCDR